MNIDVLYLVHDKDFNKFPKSYRQLKQNLKDTIDKVYVVTPNKNKFINEFKNIITPSFVILSDEETGIAKNPNTFRPNWLWQQFVKTLNSFITNRYWLVVDADVFFIEPITFFNEKNNPIVYRNNHPGSYNIHGPYFDFIERRMNFVGKRDKSFVCDFMLFDREMLNRLWQHAIGTTEKSKCIEHVEKYHSAVECFSEYEVYGQFATQQDIWAERQIKGMLKGVQGGADITDAQYNQAYNEAIRNSQFTHFTYHTWG